MLVTSSSSNSLCNPVTFLYQLWNCTETWRWREGPYASFLSELELCLWFHSADSSVTYLHRDMSSVYMCSTGATNTEVRGKCTDMPLYHTHRILIHWHSLLLFLELCFLDFSCHKTDFSYRSQVLEEEQLSMMTVCFVGLKVSVYSIKYDLFNYHTSA